MVSTDRRDSSATWPVLPVQIGDIWIAIDPRCVQEVLGSRTWMRIPGASPFLPGVLGWRSRAIAVLELREVLGLSSRSQSQPPRTVVARIADCTFAFFVEVAREARTVDAGALSAPHAVTGKFVTHQLTLDGRMMPLIDLTAVIETVAGASVESA
jgi:chemotaxis signal transduction protein